MSKTYSISEKFLFPATRLNQDRCREHFAGKRMIITGASYGIGEQLAYLLGEFGADLILIARTEEKLKEVCQTINSKGGKADSYALDLRNEISLDRLILELQTEYDEVQYLIHCAGLSIRRSFQDSQDRFHDVQRTMAIRQPK